MQWLNGFGYSFYTKLMLISCDLDEKGKIWKYVKSKKRK